MENEVKISKIDPKEFGLTDQNAETIEQAFIPKIVERNELIELYALLLTKEITMAVCIEAKELRLKLVKIRTGISDIHKTQKAFFLAAGRFVDAWKNKETLPVEQMEENLKAIETHYEKIEAEKKKAIVDARISELALYGVYDVVGIADMSNDVWNSFLIGVQKTYNDKIEAEKQAEIERIEALRISELYKSRKESILHLWNFLTPEAKETNFGQLDENSWNSLVFALEQKLEIYNEEQAKIKAENEKLREANEAKENQLKAEKEKAEREATLAKQKADAELKEANEAKEKLEAELKQKKDAEIKAENDRLFKLKQDEIESKKAAKAPIKKQLTIWVDGFKLPDLSLENQTKNDILLKFEAFKNWAKSEINNL